MLQGILRSYRNNEDGNSIALFLITFPIITLVFGFIVDTLTLNYAKSAVQSAADSTAVVIASSLELNGFNQGQAQQVYAKNLDNAKNVLACKKSTCGGTLNTSIDLAKKRVCVTVSEKVDFLFLDSLPFGLFGSAGDSMKTTISNFGDIKIVNPGASTEANLKNRANDYACAIIK